MTKRKYVLLMLIATACFTLIFYLTQQNRVSINTTVQEVQSNSEVRTTQEEPVVQTAAESISGIASQELGHTNPLPGKQIASSSNEVTIKGKERHLYTRLTLGQKPRRYSNTFYKLSLLAPIPNEFEIEQFKPLEPNVNEYTESCYAKDGERCEQGVGMGNEQFCFFDLSSDDHGKQCLFLSYYQQPRAKLANNIVGWYVANFEHYKAEGCSNRVQPTPPVIQDNGIFHFYSDGVGCDTFWSTELAKRIGATSTPFYSTYVLPGKDYIASFYYRSSLDNGTDEEKERANLFKNIINTAKFEQK